MASLQEKVAARRKAREQERTFVLPVPGWEDLFAARYRPLPFEELVDLQGRYADAEGPDGMLMVRAATLARSCVELLEVKGENEFQSIGCGWTPKGVSEHLGIVLPDDATPYDVLSSVMNGVTGDSELFAHFSQWDAKASESVKVEEEAALGESRPSVEG